VVAGDSTWWDLVVKFTTSIIGQMASAGVNAQKAIYHHASIFSGSVRKAQINLLDLNLSFVTKSSLKMQNRTIPVAGADQADDINHVPLTCRSYAGWSNGPDYKSVMQLPTTKATSDYGSIAFGAGTRQQLMEPPQPSVFQGAVKTGKFTLGAGSIKTSIITHKQIISFDNLMHEFSQIYCQGISTPQTKFRYSKYILYAFEKTLAVVGEGAVNIISEFDVKNWCTLLPRVDRYTIPYVNTAQ